MFNSLFHSSIADPILANTGRLAGFRDLTCTIPVN